MSFARLPHICLDPNQPVDGSDPRPTVISTNR